MQEENVGVFTWCFSPDCEAVVIITGSIFDHNARVAVDANDFGIHLLSNNTIVANQNGVILINPASKIENSIIVHNGEAGLVGYNKSSTNRYNDVRDNGTDYREPVPGPGDLTISLYLRMRPREITGYRSIPLTLK